MPGRLQGKRALIFGGATGIGFACAQSMARDGARVFLSGRREERLVEAVARLASMAPAFHLRGDATVEADVARVTTAAVDALGGLDTLVWSAGAARIGSIEDESLEGFRGIVQANLDSVFLSARAAVKPLREAGGGSIVAISSILGLVGASRRVAYCAAKAGIIGMVRAMALDLASDRIRVNAICPGFIDTEMSRAVIAREPDPEAVMEQRRSGNPIPRAGLPEEIGALAAYLASDAAAWTTGQHLVVDGGFTIR
jgi:NAD(P)-dependent dehydrogenase (short-subunit alcohol dehydrogenase family)